MFNRNRDWLAPVRASLDYLTQHKAESCGERAGDSIVRLKELQEKNPNYLLGDVS